MTTAHRGWRWSLWSEVPGAVHRLRGIRALDRVHWVIPIGRFHRIRGVAVRGGVGSQRGVALRGRLDVVRHVLAKPPQRHAMNEGREHGRLVPHRARPLNVAMETNLYGERGRSSWSTVDW
jgi:hypothetical protein